MILSRKQSLKTIVLTARSGEEQESADEPHLTLLEPLGQKKII